MESGKRVALLSVVGIIVAIGLMVGAGFAIARRVQRSVREIEIPRVERVAVDASSGDDSAAVASIVRDFADFDSVYTAGGWTVELVYGEGFDVRVDASEKALEELEVFQRGRTLHLELDSGIRSVTGNLTARITLPDLERLEADGGVNVTIDGFDLDSLVVEVDGAASVMARNGSIENLDINSDGAASFNLSGIDVTNAHIDMDGASELDITMVGGDLTGAVRGVGQVTYRGDVSTERIQVEGLGRVKRQ